MKRLAPILKTANENPPSNKPLTKRQRQAVEAVITTRTYVEAAEKAGMQENNLRRMLRYPHVAQYLRDYVSEFLIGEAVVAAHTLGDLMRTSDSDHVRRASAEAILDRSGVVSTSAISASGVSINIDLGARQDGIVIDTDLHDSQ